MTNWEKIKSLYPNADKQFIIGQFGIVINKRKNPILAHCSVLKCSECIFTPGNCLGETIAYLDKEVNE